MHALCVVVAKTIPNIQLFMNNKCDWRDWDYAVIGGRYENIIPVSLNTKTKLALPFPFGNGVEENGFPYGPELNNLDCKYVSIARIRNIDRQEVQRLQDLALLNPFNPYSYILETEDGEQTNEIFIDEETIEGLMNYINDPCHSYYYLAVVDYHF